MPWDTPDKTGHLEEETPSKITHWDRPFRNDEIQLCTLPLIPYTIVICTTVSVEGWCYEVKSVCVLRS